MIVETATVIRKDGTTMKLGREKGKQRFVVTEGAGADFARSYTRRQLEERPQRDRGVDRVEFEKATKEPVEPPSPPTKEIH